MRNIARTLTVLCRWPGAARRSRAEWDAGIGGAEEEAPWAWATVLDLVHHSNVRFAYYKPGVCRHPKVTPVPDFDTM